MNKKNLYIENEDYGGLQTIDYEAIREVLTENDSLLSAWAEYLGEEKDDRRIILGLNAKQFIPFYAGFVAGINAKKD